MTSKTTGESCHFRKPKKVSADELYTGLPISVFEGKSVADEITQIDVILDDNNAANIQFFDVLTNTLTNLAEPKISASSDLSETVSNENVSESSEAPAVDGTEFDEPFANSSEIFSSEDLVT